MEEYLQMKTKKLLRIGRMSLALFLIALGFFLIIWAILSPYVISGTLLMFGIIILFGLAILLMKPKGLLGIGIIALLVLTGCTGKPITPTLTSDYCAECNGISFCSPEPINCSDRRYAPVEMMCFWNYFEIKYVDEIPSDNCYAIKQEELTSYEKDMIRNSLKYAGWTYGDMEDQWYKEYGTNCAEIIIRRTYYCLKDNSTCLRIEDNKICEIVKFR